MGQQNYTKKGTAKFFHFHLLVDIISGVLIHSLTTILFMLW